MALSSSVAVNTVQKLPSFLQVATVEALLEGSVDLLVFLMESIVLPELFEAVIQGLDDQFVLNLGVGLKHGGENAGHRLHFPQGLQAG